MIEQIVTCGCNDTDEFAKNAFRLLFARNDYPHISHNHPISQNQQIQEFVNSLNKTKKPYAYYFKESDVVEVWDLMKGVRIQ